MKRKVSVSIDQKIYEKAHALGINVSKVSENALLNLIEAIENTKGQKPVFSEAFSREKGSVVRSPRFEPGSSAWQRDGGNVWSGPTEVDWVAFEEHLKAKNYRGTGYRTKLSYATRYHGLLFRGELGKLAELSPDGKSNALKALSVLCEFLGCKNLFKAEMQRFGLTWTGKSADKLFIERLMKADEIEDVWSWIRQVKRARADLAPFMDLMAVTGLREVEGVNCINLVLELNKIGVLDKYYNVEKQSFEHFRFEDVFIRRSKKAFVSFVPADLVKQVCESSMLASAEAVSKSLRKLKLNPRFGDIREAQGSFMVKYLKETEIDFIHGRVTGTVFKTHYFNPATIADLKTRVFQGIAEIQEKIRV